MTGGDVATSVRQAECALAAGSGVYVRVHCQTCYLLCEQVRLALASRRARAGYICVARASLHKAVECRSSPPLS